MHMGMVTGEYPPMEGGVGAYTRVLARALVEQGHTVSIFTNQAASCTDPGIHLTAAAKSWGLDTVRQLNKWVSARQIDVLNVQYQTAAYQMSPWVHFIPNLIHTAPVITTFHDLLPPYLFPKAGRLRQQIVFHLARASAAVVATNPEDFQRVQHLPGAELIPIGSNILTEPPSDFDRVAWRQQAGATDDDFLIGHFGFVNRSKGLELLLDALHAQRGRGLPWKLVMIGGRTGTSDPTNAAYVSEIDVYIDRLNLTPIVHWTGFVDDAEVSAYLKAVDVVVLPYRDGASYRRGSLMAAIQHGCAIITTQPQAPTPTFEDGRNMLLVPRSDSAAIMLGERMVQTYQSPELRDKLRQGAAQLKHEFDWSQIARDIVALSERIR